MDEIKIKKILNLYNEYVNEIMNINDISRWGSKRTITTKILNPERTNEQKVLDALKGTEYSEGDKRWFYFKKDGSLELVENFKNDHDDLKLLEKLYKTAIIFQNVIPKNIFVNYKLKKNYKLLTKLN